MGATTKGYPYPDATDGNNVPADLQALAEAVDAAPGIASLTQAQIDALSAGHKTPNLVVYNATTSRLQRWNGASWVNVPDAASVDTLTNKTIDGDNNTLQDIPQSAITGLVTALAGKASLAGATFTGEVDVVSATAAGSTSVRQITISTSDPTGGADGDVWIKYV